MNCFIIKHDLLILKTMMIDDDTPLCTIQVYLMEDSECKVAPATTGELRQCAVKVAQYLASLAGSTAMPLPDGNSLRIGMANITPIYLSYFAKAKIPTFAEELTMLKGKVTPGREMVNYLIEQIQ